MRSITSKRLISYVRAILMGYLDQRMFEKYSLKRAF